MQGRDNNIAKIHSGPVPRILLDRRINLGEQKHSIATARDWGGSQSGSRQSTTDTGAGASSASSQYSGTLPEASSLDKYTHSPGSSSNGSAFPSSLGPSLPGLSALASVASAPTSNLRASSSNAQPSMANMTYATSSPAATTGGQGNNPVSF
ncbi:hypothetical protein CBS63078_2555 [Aspergillus niger]|nr:hypothetical protein CBS115989_2365 [Aspergillus niger]KAI2830797.1 hypothetical protein CBS133816_3216 [Aspergillus niger]KAI2836019.1 hypothetical protein CBS11350_9660 [Aspergillus niger]KAI2844832.1 hypothetical protein CBS12448_9851 [Aspergillus niger]KAI2854362.1 hypothetical protein CBS11232_4952 [Aspergillus niger]